MVFLLFLLAIFVLVSIYFFFRSEGLSKELRLAKRETQEAAKEHKGMLDTMTLLAHRHEEFVKFRLKEIQESATNQAQKDQIELISPLINNYSAIFLQCLKSGSQLKTISQKYFDGHKKGSFKEFIRYITKQEAHVKRMWSGNNFNGFISLVEALLYEEGKAEDTLADPEN
jgi:hypothetical protein